MHGPVQLRHGRNIRLLMTALVATLLVQIGGISLLEIRPVLAAAGPGSLVVTGNGGSVTSPCGGPDNLVSFTLPTGKEISEASAYTVEAWVKVDSATNPTGTFDQTCGGMKLHTSEFTGLTDSWNQRGAFNGSGASQRSSYYISNNGVVQDPRCDVFQTLALCPLVTIGRGQWQHLAFQKSVVAGVTRLTVFIDGKILTSRVVGGNSASTMLKYVTIGGLGTSRTGKVSYGQMRITSGSLYPTDGTTTFAPTYDFSSTVSGGTVSSGASVISLFKPQDNSTIANLVDLTSNGTVIKTYVASSLVAASSDYASPPPPAFSYSSATVTTTTGVAITANNVVSTGGDINSFSISPALPNGLMLNTTTGTLSGTPTVYSATTNYVVTGTQNSSGLTTTATVSITVNKPSTSISIALASGNVQVGVVNTITATTSVAGTVSFQTDQGVISGCSSIATTVLSSYTATCPWTPTSTYYTMNATLTPTSNDLAQSTSAPSLTNIRGSLSLTSTGTHVYPDGSGSLSTNNSVLFTFPENEGLNSSKSFAIETWVKVASSTLNMKMSASFGNSFYPDRGEGFIIDQGGTRIVPFVNTGFMGYKTVSAVSAGTWQNVVLQRTIVANQPSQSFDSIFINGQLISQYGNIGGGIAQSIKIGPFVGVTQVGPTQVLTNTAPYPVSGFAPSTTYTFGPNTLALFQPSSTTCGSTVMAPATVTVSYQTATTSCSSDFPVALPSVSSVVSSEGPTAGGNTVVISGSNFVGLTGISFGATALNASNYSVNTFGNQITATVPAGTAGIVDVKVTTSAGTSSVVAADKYTYVSAPSITGISKSTGSINGGTSVVITGSNFTNTSAVTFGASNASFYSVNSATQITAVSPAGSAGVVDIRVTTTGGTSAIVAADQFTYTSSVTVTGISPASGSTSGGTAVVISGTNFTNASTVTFGATNATSFSVDSANSITAVSPAGTAGVVDIRVTAPGGTSAIVAADQYSYTSSITVTGISPSFGSVAGGSSVVITGTNLAGATAVTFGSIGATSFVINSATQITAVSPAGTAGVVDIRVTAPGGTSAIVAADQFTYYPIPTVSNIGTSAGLTDGGTSVVITGTNFANVSAVTFGSNNASSFTVNSATQITAVSPSASAGVVDVRVNTLGGVSQIISADQFTYWGLPTISDVAPASGPTVGATSVVITGTNFLGATSVTFGTTNATSFTVNSATQITAVSPARVAGNVDIKVGNPGGISAVSLYGLYGQFTYLSAPTVSAVSPSTGSITGGVAVTITGTNLSNLVSNGGVMFGSVPAQSVLLVDPTHIQAVAPVTTATGAVHITLTNASGTSAQTSADLFTYTRSDDARLSALTLSAGTLSPVFASGTTAYTISNAKDGMRVTPTVNAVGAVSDVKVGSGSFTSVASGTASSPLSLVLGSNTITVRVTADDGTTIKTYTITATRLSSVATLSGASFKGVNASLGTPSDTIGSETAGSVTLTTAQGTGSAASTFTKTDAGATITKIVKFASGTTENSANFAAATAFTNGATTQVVDGDFFVVQVTAADGTVNYTRVNVTVNSNVATLSSGVVKGQSGTLGTAHGTIGSETAGSITLTTAQGTGSLTTSFTATSAGATITKIAKFGSGATESLFSFTAATAFTNGAATQVVDGDFFVVQVTAADGTVNYTRVNVTVNSNVATLSGSSVKGITASLGTPSDTIGSETAGSVTITTSQGAGSATTSFTKTHVGATITKIAKFASGTTENSGNFTAATGFTNGASTQVVDGDFFVVQVTAADGTVNYTRVNVVFAVSPSTPQNFTASGQQGGAVLTWDAPASDGGSAITGYVVQKSIDAINWLDAGTTNAITTSYSVTGLSNGTSYFYRVRATNASGNLSYNFATSEATTTDYFVFCSISGSFYVRGTTIPSAAGKDCAGTASIPQGIIGVAINSFAPGSGATSTNRALTGLIFPASGFKNIDQGGFRNLGLTTLVIPASVTMVGLSAFENNPLTTVTVTGGSGGESTYLSQGAFNNQDPLFGLSTSVALTFGSGKIEIGYNFGFSTKFSTVDFGSGISSIGETAFKANGIPSGWIPTFPSNITSISRDAFTSNPNIKTIRFGSSTTSAITSISDYAFDTAITDVQYCGPGGTVLSNYLARRLPSAVIWCSTEVPNAPISLNASAASGQVALTWTRGALRNEAPTSDFLVQYSSNNGSTWNTFSHAASLLNSITVTGLSNGTNYLFRVGAVNLFGTSAYSATASAKPLGQSFTPIFGASTSTANGFTVSITNFDSSFVFDSPTVTAGSGSVTIGNPIGGVLPITVTGMPAGSTSTISIRSSKQGVSDGIGYASGSALQAALIPLIDNIVSTTGGLLARIANYDANVSWTATATPGNVAINSSGIISVSGVSSSTQIVLTVNTSRSGYVSGTSSTTATTLQLLQVLYDGNGATGGAVPTDSLQYNSDDIATVLGVPSRGGISLNGNTFVGWTTNQNGTGPIYQAGSSLQLASTTVTMYAKWSLIPYKVTYKANGATSGSVPIDQASYTIGQDAPIFGNTGNLARTGYLFIGWGYNSTETDVLYRSGDPYTVGTSNISFWARWTPETYAVTYDTNGASGSPSKSSDVYTTGLTPITLPTVGTMAKTGYTFAGWGLAPVSTSVSDSYTVSEDTKLYAQWHVVSYSVTYLPGTNGIGTPPTQVNVNYASSFSVATSVGLSASDGVNDYAFVAWSDGTRTYSPSQTYLMGASPVVLTAQWTRIYNVKYSFNGGNVSTPIADQQKVSGDVVAVSSVVPARAGYAFVNWKDQSGSIVSAGDAYTVSDGHYLLYAQWRTISYTVTYDVNGGDSEPSETNHVIGDTFNVAAAPAKTGYDFAYWSDGTNHYNAGTSYQVGAADVSLQAVWTPQVYQILFDFNGGVGSPISPINYTFNTAAANLPTTGISRPDYAFRGWSTSAAATNGTSTFTPSGDVMLRAVWVPSVYRLTFNPGSGYSDRNSEKVIIGQATTLPSATRANYNLLGWSTQESGGTTLPAGGTYIPTADATLYARWALQVFTVTYDGNGGTSAQGSDTMTYGSQAPIVLPNAGRLNYVFNGWYSASRGGYLLGVAGANYSPTTSLTAYAHWIQGSLAGMGPATQIAQVTVHAGYDASFTAGSNGSTATVSYVADSLPDGTVITAFVETSTARVAPLLSTPANPILTLIISWVAPDGTVPNTATGKPIVMTILNSNITAGSKVYGLIGNAPVYLGTSVEDGLVQVAISEDPAVIVALVTPDAPRNVIATEVDATTARVSWTGPVSNGGSAITRFTATSNGGQSCSSTTGSCVIAGLMSNVDYTFTVVATNAIGNGPASNASQAIRLGVPVISPTTSAPAVVSASPSSGNVASNVNAGTTTKVQQDKEALETAGDVLTAVKDKAAEDALHALESKNGKDSANSKEKPTSEKKASETNSGSSQDSQNNALIVLLVLMALLLAAFVARRTFAKQT